MKDTIYIKKYDIKLDKYLTINDVNAIVESARKISNFIERDIFIDKAVLQICGHIDEPFVSELSYDMLCKDGILDIIHKKIKNYDLIEKYINKYESVPYMIHDFIDDIGSYLEDAIKKLPTLKDVVEVTQNTNGYK